MDLNPEMILACPPPAPGGWRMWGPMLAFVLLAWAYGPRPQDASDKATGVE